MGFVILTQKREVQNALWKKEKKKKDKDA